MSARFGGFLSSLGLALLGASAGGGGDGGVDLSLQGLDSLLEELDGAGLVGGEGGFGEGVVVDEDGFGEEKLLERVEIGGHLRQICHRSAPSLSFLALPHRLTAQHQPCLLLTR